MKIIIKVNHSAFAISESTTIKVGDCEAFILKNKGRYYATCTGTDRSNLYMLLVQLKEQVPNVVLRANYPVLHAVAKSLNWTSRSTKPWPKIVDLYTTEGTPQETGYARFRKELASLNNEVKKLQAYGINLELTESEVASTCATKPSSSSYWSSMLSTMSQVLADKYNNMETS
jgi:uncharacterized protein with NAD-binding domain and iron-sulfur cluster